MGSSQSLSHCHGQKMKQQQNGLYEQKQLAALKTISSIQQFIVVQLPTETIVDILLFVPNEELVLSFVFVSRTFSAICIPILRTRFADNISTWVKQFTIPCDDYPRNLNSNNEIVSLMWANVCNWKYSEFSGFIKVKIPKHILRRNPIPKFDRSQNRFKCARARRFSAPTFLDDSTAEPIVSVHYTCCMNSNNGSDKYEYKEEKAMLLNKYRDELNIYSFHVDVPKNTNRFMQLKFYIQCNYDGKVYYDKNGNELYVFASKKGILGRTKGTAFYLLVLLLLLLLAFYYFWFWPSSVKY